MIFPGFPGVLSFSQVFQVELEPWLTLMLSVNGPLQYISGADLGFPVGGGANPPGGGANL